MSAEAKTLSGGCLCGAVRFTAAPHRHKLGACHCGMCRRWSAGPFLALEVGATLKIEDTTHLGVYRSSDWAERCFCSRCGTVLFYRLVGKNYDVVSSEAFDDRRDFSFVSQIFVDEKPAYYDFANETKMQTGAEVFAEFAAAEGQAKA
jgi:hypothetical protein